MKALTEAREILRKFRDRLGANPQARPDRPEVVAFATLTALVSHFPNRATPEDGELLAATHVVLEFERDRFYKQRRIALTNLAAEA